MREIIRAEGLTKIYGRGRAQIVALDGVNLKVERGEFIAILGPSGSGKTTLLNLLGGLDRPTAGRILIDGEDITSLPERELYRVRRYKVGFIFQAYHLIPSLTALQNVLLPLLPERRREEEKARELLRLVGLEGREEHLPGELSGGEQQRVAIARALVNDPAIVLADEPTGNLDSKSGRDILNFMLELNRERGVTFLVVTHDRKIAEEARRILYLKDGRLSETPFDSEVEGDGSAGL